MKSLVVCLDISESMSYGEPTKLHQAIDVINASFSDLAGQEQIGLITFDVEAQVLVEPKTSNFADFRAEMESIVTRGVSCLADGVDRSFKMVREIAGGAEMLIVTDARPNLSLDRMGGFEGSIALEEEILRIADESGKNIKVHAVAVGEDAFTHTLIAVANKCGGDFWIGEDFKNLNTPPIKPSEFSEMIELEIHDAPAELPSARPTWTKESQMMHVAVVCDDLYHKYLESRRAFLFNLRTSREARTGLLSIDSDLLSEYSQRRAKTASDVKDGDAILLDRSYRDFLGLKRNDKVKLIIY